MASYWTRKDDQSEELKTIKPWEEALDGGNREYPDPETEKTQPHGAE